jgi:hypothetical protein
MLFFMDPPEMVDENIGTANEVSVATYKNNGEIVFTNEPAIRIFTGKEYGPNIAEGKIQKSDMQKFTGPVTIDYDPVVGITLWGVQE